MARWLQVAIPIVVAVAAFFLEPGYWKSIRSEAMLVLSVLAAAVLFRLGRGFPPVAIEEMEIGEAKHLADTFKVVARRLAWVAAVTAVALLCLAGMEVGYKLIVLLCSPETVETCARAAGSMLAFVIALAFCRAVMVVLGDLSAITVQSDYIVKSVQRRHARNAAAAHDEAERAKPFERPPNYGDFVEPH